jgi:hypothetical protein
MVQQCFPSFSTSPSSASSGNLGKINANEHTWVTVTKQKELWSNQVADINAAQIIRFLKIILLHR